MSRCGFRTDAGNHLYTVLLSLLFAEAEGPGAAPLACASLSQLRNRFLSLRPGHPYTDHMLELHGDVIECVLAVSKEDIIGVLRDDVGGCCRLFSDMDCACNLLRSIRDNSGVSPRVWRDTDPRVVAVHLGLAHRYFLQLPARMRGRNQRRKRSASRVSVDMVPPMASAPDAEPTMPAATTPSRPCPQPISVDVIPPMPSRQCPRPDVWVEEWQLLNSSP